MALIGEHHGQSERAQKLGLKIIGHMRERCDARSAEKKLNYTLLATPAEGLSGRFVKLDQKRYGKIAGVTDREYYTNSFHIPVYCPISAFDKIRLEAPYHALTNAGHISYIEMDGDPTKNLDAFEKVVRYMHDVGIGYGSINHPVDRDPICGYVGVIGEVCPRCGRREGEAVSPERIKELRKLYPGTFTLSKKSAAKTSSWAESDVNLALNDDLLDTALLGSDYTKPISRLQFCSVAVRLAETLTGKSITPAAANTFTDTNNAYVLKAYAAGITTGTSATTFSPNATLNRQQMATFLRRTLQYVEKNSGYSYTSYTSKLASYTDNALVQSWAKEAMAFMNALDLVKGTTATTLNPNGTCTIEQAVIVAERSVYAHQIGWYQAAPVTNVYSYNGSTGEIEREDGEYTSFDSTNASLHPGDLVWITGKLTGVSNLLATAPGTTVDQCVYSAYLPGINPYTGQIMYLHYRDLIPVRG